MRRPRKRLTIMRLAIAGVLTIGFCFAFMKLAAQYGGTVQSQAQTHAREFVPSVMAGITAEESGLDNLAIRTATGTVHQFKIELADTPAKMEQGLMNREHMDADAGMLFLLGGERSIAMWMKNTLIPLDMLFIEADGRVAQIQENAEPMSEDHIYALQPVSAVLELNGGTAERLGINVGDTVVHSSFKR